MALWLFKEEPDHYAFTDLQRDGRATWDGVTNNLARQNLRQVRKGDRILYYHTGKEKAVVGEMRAVTDAGPYPNDNDPKSVVVAVEAVRGLSQPVSLARIKADANLQDWDLVRNSRLSVMPVSKAQWSRIEALSREQ